MTPPTPRWDTKPPEYGMPHSCRAGAWIAAHTHGEHRPQASARTAARMHDGAEGDIGQNSSNRSKQACDARPLPCSTASAAKPTVSTTACSQPGTGAACGRLVR
jgi:hypothetical protein